MLQLLFLPNLVSNCWWKTPTTAGGKHQQWHAANTNSSNYKQQQ